jgi:hypothetical protein
MPSRNLAARAGRWSAQHRRTAILGWILFVVLATVLGGMVGQKNIDPSASGNGESKRGDMIVDAAGYPDQTGEQVLIQGKGAVTARDPQVTAAVKDVVERLGTTKGVTDVKSPLNAQDRANTVSEDGRSVVVNFTMPGKAEDTEKLVDKPLAAVAAVQRTHRDVRVEEFGGASSAKALAKADEKNKKASEMFSYPATLIILLVAFGALIAAGFPLLLGATAVLGTLGLLGPVSQLTALSPAVAQVVMLIGLAVGVDYAMFYLRREMEERDRGRSPESALDIAAATSGRAVLISGVTVMTAMAGMFLAGNPIFASFGRRHHPRRRRRHARIGHRAPGDAVLPQPQGLDGEGPPALHRQAAPRHPRRVAHVGRHPGPRPEAPAGLGRHRRRHPRRPDDPRPRDAVQGPGRRRLLPQPPDHADLRPHRGRVPWRRRPGDDGHQGQGRHDAPGPDCHQGAPREGDRHGPALRAVQRRSQPRQDRRRRRPVGQGQRHRRRVGQVAAGAA